MALNLDDYVFISPDTGLPVWIQFPDASDIAQLKPSNPDDVAVIHRRHVQVAIVNLRLQAQSVDIAIGHELWCVRVLWRVTIDIELVRVGEVHVLAQVGTLVA